MSKTSDTLWFIFYSFLLLSLCPELFAVFPNRDHIIVEASVLGLESMYSADLDGDSDVDILYVSRTDDKIAQYENNGSGQFSSQKVITLDADSTTSVYAADLDDDGDLDVLSASSSLLGHDKIAWYENDLID